MHAESAIHIGRNRLLSEQEAAEFLGLKPTTLTTWRCVGRYPDLPYIRLGGGRAIRYRLADLEAWVQKHRSPTPYPVGEEGP